MMIRIADVCAGMVSPPWLLHWTQFEWAQQVAMHIMVFHNQELLTWYEPYWHYVCFLTSTAAAGTCGMEKCIIVSGGRNPKPVGIVEEHEGRSRTADMSVTLIMWEAYTLMREIKMLDWWEFTQLPSKTNHSTVQEMIHDGGNLGTVLVHVVLTDSAWVLSIHS